MPTARKQGNDLTAGLPGRIDLEGHDAEILPLLGIDGDIVVAAEDAFDGVLQRFDDRLKAQAFLIGQKPFGDEDIHTGRPGDGFEQFGNRRVSGIREIFPPSYLAPGLTAAPPSTLQSRQNAKHRQRQGEG